MVLPLVAAAAGRIVGGLLQGRAAEKAKDAQIHAQMQAEQRLQRASERAELLQGPYLQGGYTGYNALTQRLNLPTGNVQGATDRAIGDTGGDWARYLQQNPDVAADAQKAVGRGDFASVREFAQRHYDTAGRAEGRQLPMMAGMGNEPGQRQSLIGTATSTATSPAQGSPTTMEAPAGNALTGAGGVYGNGDNPRYTPQSYQAPQPFSFDINSFKDNPAYKFALEQGTGQVLASSAATGALQSGAALKALQDRGQRTAYSFYDQERDFAFGKYRDDRDFGYGQHIDDRNFTRRNYEEDRNYLTDRYDRQTDDLFRYTGMGQHAAGVVTNAALGQGTQSANLALAGGDARAGNALQQGSIWSGIASDIAGLGASYFNSRKPKG